MLVGTAWQDITPAEPIDLMGQMHIRKGVRTRDPLTVNAIVLRESGETITLVSVDVGMLDDHFVRPMQREIASAHGLKPESIIMHSTHTHVAPCTLDYVIGDVDAKFMSNLRRAIVFTVGKALADLEEADLYSASGFVPHMGWNRRGLHDGGKCDMYYGSWRPNFEGIEGPRDGQVPVIFARRPNGDVKAIITGFTTHPNCLEGESFYSADIPGAVRKYVRRVLGENVGVVYLTGAAGDTAPSIMENNPQNLQPWRGEVGVERSGAYLGAKIVELVQSTHEPFVAKMPSILKQAQVELDIPVRAYPASFDPLKLEWKAGAEYFERERKRWPEIIRNNCTTRLNVIRIGDAAICTNPSELYCQLGHDIKRTSPAKMTMIAELTDGYAGYVPTKSSFARAGYSTMPGETCKLEEDADSRIIDATRKLMSQLF